MSKPLDRLPALLECSRAEAVKQWDGLGPVAGHPYRSPGASIPVKDLDHVAISKRLHLLEGVDFKLRVGHLQVGQPSGAGLHR